MGSEVAAGSLMGSEVAAGSLEGSEIAEGSETAEGSLKGSEIVVGSATVGSGSAVVKGSPVGSGVVSISILTFLLVPKYLQWKVLCEIKLCKDFFLCVCFCVSFCEVSRGKRKLCKIFPSNIYRVCLSHVFLV